MRLNGLYLVAELAVRKLESALVHRYRKPLLLGSLREDVWYLPFGHTIVEHLSFSHFYRPPLPGGIVPFLWPGPKLKGNLFFDRAVREYGEGRRASGFLQLGRVAHLMADMACPVHAHRTIHETDPFEWYVEGNKDKILALEVPDIADADRPAALLEGMAAHTQAFRPDKTNHWAGRVMRRLGVWERVSAKEAGEQARALIPVAAGYTVAVLRLFLRAIGER